MSLRVIGYRDGKPIVVDEGPASAHAVSLGGDLVRGERGVPRKRDNAEASKRYREARKANGG